MAYTIVQGLKVAAIVALLALLAWALSNTHLEPAPPVREAQAGQLTLTRWHDPDYAVTCWVCTGGACNGGVSCLADSDFE